MSHTPVESFLQEIQRYRYLQIPMVDPKNLGSDAGAILEVVEHNRTGLLFHDGNPDALANPLIVY